MKYYYRWCWIVAEIMKAIYERDYDRAQWWREYRAELCP